MKTKILVIFIALLLVGVTGAMAGEPVSERGMESFQLPTAYPGNFVSTDDDQVCYDMSALGFIGEVTEEMRGFRVDPPVDFTTADGCVSVDVSVDGKLIDWTSTCAEVVVFIVKGGAAYNVYDYLGTGYDWDNGLGAPPFVGKKGRAQFPRISHYNGCYIYLGVGITYQGCTPGYWRNHVDRWHVLDPGYDFDATFGVDLFTPDVTLGNVLKYHQTYGTFAFHSVAALLNSYGGVPNAEDVTECTPNATVTYRYSPEEVIQMVQDAVENGTFEETKELFETENELGCPLCGTKAKPVP